VERIVLFDVKGIGRLSLYVGKDGQNYNPQTLFATATKRYYCGKNRKKYFCRLGLPN